ncbi:Serpin B3 [Bulinus truncatus]|nr:Serpin B3 [Bulinus truncatus]
MLLMCAALVLVIAGQLVNADQQFSLSSASSGFSQNLYQRIALDEPNVIYSPYSIHSVLTMTSLGARGVTLNEMRTTLGISSLGDEVHGVYKELIQQFNSVTGVEIHTGNAIFVNSNYQIQPKFISDTSNYYLAKTDNIKLTAIGGPAKPINDYIAAQTKNIIKDLLGPDDIDANTVMVLINTIFFNGTWLKEFNKHSTKSSNFTLPGGGVKQVEMMKDMRNVNIKRDNSNGVDIAELPFKGSRFSMYIALPQKVDGVIKLEQLLSQPGKVQELLSGLIIESADLAIPKFKIETKFNLNTALKSLGIVKAFQPNADFSGITSQGQVYISDVIHKAVIEVQETGTVAAAATAVVMTKSASFTSITRTSFIADHPFVYFLRDNQTGQILFQGKFSG